MARKTGNSKEREFETAMDEFFKGLSGPMLAIHLANMKRTFDEYQDIGTKAARSQGKLADRIGQNSENHSEQIRNLCVQHLQNAVQNQDFAAKGYLERINGVNSHVWANMDLTSDAFATILATKIADKLNGS